MPGASSPAADREAHRPPQRNLAITIQADLANRPTTPELIKRLEAALTWWSPRAGAPGSPPNRARRALTAMAPAARSHGADTRRLSPAGYRSRPSALVREHGDQPSSATTAGRPTSSCSRTQSRGHARHMVGRSRAPAPSGASFAAAPIGRQRGRWARGGRTEGLSEAVHRRGRASVEQASCRGRRVRHRATRAGEREGRGGRTIVSTGGHRAQPIAAGRRPRQERVGAQSRRAPRTRRRQHASRTRKRPRRAARDGAANAGRRTEAVSEGEAHAKLGGAGAWRGRGWGPGPRPQAQSSRTPSPPTSRPVRGGRGGRRALHHNSGAGSAAAAESRRHARRAATLASGERLEYIS